MPALPKITDAVLADLARQLRFAPAAKRLAHVERLESLAAELDPAGSYPIDWITFRLTGYRSDSSAELGRVVSGGVLLANLSALAEALTKDAGLSFEALRDKGSLDLASLAEAFGASVKTIERWRRRGLVARRTLDRQGVHRLVFMPAVVEAFRLAHAADIERVGAFRRLSDEERAAIIRRAATYRRKLGWSLDRCAKHLSDRTGRSVAGLRDLLSREPGFSDPAPISAFQRRVMFRAFLRGAEVASLARHFDCAPSAVHRGLALERLARLAGLPLPAGPGARIDEESLQHDSVRAGLVVPAPTDLAALLDLARRRPPIDRRREFERLSALRTLLQSATADLAGLSRTAPSPVALDRIETRLRWASALMGALLGEHLTLIVETADLALGARLESLRPHDAIAVWRGCLAAAAQAASHVDPSRGARLAAAVGLAVQHAAARLARDHAPLPHTQHPARAASVLTAGTPVPPWTRALAPWQAWLLPDPRVEGVLHLLPTESRDLLLLRFGFGGDRPRTLNETAAELHLSRTSIIAAQQAALRRALEIARGIPS